MSVTLVNNSPQLTVATAGTRGLTGAHVVNAEFSGSDLIITLSDGTVVNAGGAILSSSGSNNWVGQQAINGNVIVTGSFILSGSNTLVNIGPASLSGSVNISGSTTITGSLIVSGGTINVIGTNLISASQGVTLANTTGYTTFSSSLSQSISHSVANLSSSIGSLSGSVAGTIDSKIALVNETNSTFVSKSIFNTFATSSNTRLTSLEGESSNVRVTLNSYTQSQGLTNLRYEASQSAALQSASLFNDVSASYVISASSLQGSASAASTRLSIAENRLQGLSIASGALQQFSQSVSAVTNSLQIATASLFTSASSLNLSASNHETRLDAIESDSGSWGASTDVSALNTFATSSLASITALQSTASILVAYTTSSDNDINNLEVSASSLVISASSLRTSASTALSTNNSQASSITALNTFSASVNTSGSVINTFTSSVNTFTASVNNSLNSLTTISASLLTSASSLATSASSLRISSSNAAGRLNSIEFTTESLNTYSSSLKTAIDVTDGNLTVIGNLTVQGDTTTLNTTNLIVEDKLIELAKGTTTSVDANGAGIYISGADASIVWNNASSKIAVNKGVSITGDISVSGLVDGTDILALSSSFHTTSGSYNNVSGAIDTIINGLNAYTSSSGIKISNLNTISASYLTFTQSYYTNSSSFDERVADLEASVGGGGTGIATRVSTLETSASQAALTNSIQTNTIAGVTPQIGQLIQTASNLAGAAVGTTNQLNALNASASALTVSSSLFKDSASLAASKNNQQETQINGLHNFTQSIFTTYTASISESIRLIESNIGGINVANKINSLETTSGSLLIFQNSFLSGSDSTGSRIDRLEATASANRLTVRSLVSASDAYIAFSSSAFPQYTAATTDRINEVSNSLNNSLDGLVSDADQIVYSQSVADTTYNLYTASLYLSQSVWSNTWTPSGSLIAIPGLSRSINLKIQDVSGSITSRINGIVVGTGFIERPEFVAVTQSLYIATASLNTFSASVKASGSIINTFTQSVNLSTASLNQFTSSLKNAITTSGTDLYVNAGNLSVSGNLYVTGNIVAQQYIVSTSTYYVTESNFEGNHTFGNTYGDNQTINGTSNFYGQINLYASASDPVANPVWLKVNSSITASGVVSASGFIGIFEGAYSSSIQTNVSGTTGFSEFTSSISASINTATSSLSSSVSSSIGLLSASVASINASQVSTASLEIITSSIYNTTQSLNNSTQSLNTFSASVIATGSIINTFTSSVNSFTASVIATGSVMNTFTASVNTSTSSLNSYTSSLKAAMQVNGSDLNVSGNLYVSGNIVAQNYIVSSSVTYMTTSFSSGSTVFGNDSSDTHRLTGSVYVTGAFKLNDVSSELSIVGNGFGQTSLISPNGALVLTPGLYGVQINGANPDLQVNGNITANGYVSGAIRATNNVVSSSGQFIEYGALLTSSLSGKQAVSGTLIVSGTTFMTGSAGVDLTGVLSGSFQIKNGATRIDSVLFVSDNDYVANTYVGGDIKVNDYLAGGYTAHYDGGVQITGSLRVNAGQNGSGSYFTGSVWVTGNEAVSGNLQVVGNSSVSGNFIGTTISASSAVTASSLRVEGLTRINGEVDLDTTAITIGAGGNAVADETRLNTLNLRVDSDTFFNSNITAISGSTRFKSVAINDLSESRIPYVDSTDTLTDNANFTYNGVVFKVGGGAFEVDNATGNIRTSGSLSVGGLNISNNLNVAGAVGLQSTLTVTGSTLISSSLRATSTASFGALTVTGSTILSNRLQVGTNAAISGNLGVSGSVSLSSSLFVSGNITASANANISGDVAITGSLNAVGPTIAFGNSMTDNIYLSGNLEITGSVTRNTTNLKATGSNNPADAIYRLTEAQAWSASFVSASTLRTPDEYLEYFVGQGSNKRRYITPVWLDESLYADDYFDISVVSGADSDYVY
jgi:trimeric autotransporter adhesin